MIDVGLRTLLLAQSAITDLVGTGGVYVDQAKQGQQLPYIVISTINTEPMLALDGTYGMRSVDIDVDCYGRNALAAKTLAAVVVAFLADYSGAAGDDDTINAVLWTGQNDAPQPPTDGTQTGRHLVTVEFQIQHTPN